MQTEALASQNDLIAIHTSNLKELQKIREKDGKLTQEQADMLKGLFSDTKDYDKAVVQTADGLIVKQDALDGLIDSEQEQIEALWGTVDAIDEANDAFLKFLDTVDNSQINVLTQRTMHRICTAATNEEVSFAYRVAIPRQRFRWRNAFSTRWRSL